MYKYLYKDLKIYSEKLFPFKDHQLLKHEDIATNNAISRFVQMTVN